MLHCWMLEHADHLREHGLSRSRGRITRQFLFDLLLLRAWRSSRGGSGLVFGFSRLASLLGHAIVDGFPIRTDFFLLALSLRLLRRSAIYRRSCNTIWCTCSGLGGECGSSALGFVTPSCKCSVWGLRNGGWATLMVSECCGVMGGGGDSDDDDWSEAASSTCMRWAKPRGMAIAR